MLSNIVIFYSTLGQSIVAHYYRNVNAVVFVYDVTNPASFKSLRGWIDECQVLQLFSIANVCVLQKHAVTSGDDTPHILIGNKCDLVQSNKVKTAEAQIFADENDMALFETSALADSGIYFAQKCCLKNS